MLEFIAMIMASTQMLKSSA
ncbi:hypothetical protein Golax_019541 [Gossypium laxum]|uniref:Uncharacterized protein n=1 Tax=Gossypium laxum TaxID=34288 RepID=A0A7J8Z6U2_9ROSI|nr:hypothetical protein [Gossypium laxum]